MASTRFRYHAIERATGRIHSGEMAAESAYDVRAGLRRIGLEVDRMETVPTGAAAGWMVTTILAL